MVTFYQYLRDGKFVSEEDLKKILDEQSKVRQSTFYSAIVRLGIIPDDKLIEMASNFFNLTKITNSDHTQVDFEATEKVAGKIQSAIDNKLFVVNYKDKLTCVINDPENETLRTKITSILEQDVNFALVTKEDFEIFCQYQLVPKAISEQALQIRSNATSNDKLGDIGQTASSTERLLDMMISSALDRRASDLHLQCLDDKRARIMLRVDGKIYHFADVSSDVLPNLRNKLKTMASVGGDTPNKPVEGQIKFKHKGVDAEIRINVVSTVQGYDFVFRFIDSYLRSLEELGLSEDNYNKFMDLLHMTKGLVIICGPVGSGKTSLLYAGFKKLLAENKMIYTIEDPVEIVVPGMTQVNVKSEMGMSYEERFPSTLRHDPDVVGIGETRTKEVALQVIQASNTGRLVFTTLHTNDSVGAIARLTNMGVDSYIIGDVLAAVIAQRLVRRICPECKEAYELPENHIWRNKYNLGEGKITLHRGVGCAKCAGTGYHGRIAVHEFLITTPRLRNLIQKGATRTEIETLLENDGFKRYLDDAIDKAREGITTFEEVDVLNRDIL